MKTTIPKITVTRKQVIDLMAAAAEAGDKVQVEVCRRALNGASPGADKAWRECERVIAKAARLEAE